MIADSVKKLNIVDIELFDYNLTKNNVDQLFAKYRSYISKSDIIRKRYKSALSFDNLGIYSSQTSDPVGNKVEQLNKYRDFIDTIDKVYRLNHKDLSNDEKIIYKKSFINRMREDDLLDMLNVSSSTLCRMRKSCYIKVAMWFDLEVYKT